MMIHRNTFKAILILIFGMLFISTYAFPKRKYNQLDEKELRQGWWISYWNGNKNNIHVKNYYSDGRETKICKNYFKNGKRQAKFRYYKNRIRVKYYDERGCLIQKGWAKMDYTDKNIRFFWEGKWTFYDEFRKKISESEYLDGKMISEKIFTQ